MKQHAPKTQHKDPELLRVMRHLLRVVAQLDNLRAFNCGLRSYVFKIGKFKHKIPRRQRDDIPTAYKNKVAFSLRMLRKGVVLRKLKPLRVICKKCCREMAPKATGGKLPPNFWLCPNGCNRSTKLSSTPGKHQKQQP